MRNSDVFAGGFPADGQGRDQAGHDQVYDHRPEGRVPHDAGYDDGAGGAADDARDIADDVVAEA